MHIIWVAHLYSMFENSNYGNTPVIILVAKTYFIRNLITVAHVFLIYESWNVRTVHCYRLQDTGYTVITMIHMVIVIHAGCWLVGRFRCECNAQLVCVKRCSRSRHCECRPHTIFCIQIQSMCVSRCVGMRATKSHLFLYTFELRMVLIGCIINFHTPAASCLRPTVRTAICTYSLFGWLADVIIIIIITTSIMHSDSIRRILFFTFWYTKW